MARYDYKCPTCGTQFEVEHPMSQKPHVHCPSCGASAQQVFGASSIVFKGSGFYNTDQRGSKGATTATSAPASSGDADKGSTPTKSDTTSSTDSSSE